jgi:hypothetical protein
MGLGLLACTLPSVARADPNVDAAVVEFNNLGLTPLSAMPSGRTTYRTLAEVNTELQALATAHPDLVSFHTAPHASIEGRPVDYVEITNDVAAKDGKPVYFIMGVHHGDEWPSEEVALEFAYDIIGAAATNPQVAALLDRVRLIVLPVVNPDGFVHNRRNNCRAIPGQLDPPGMCPVVSTLGVDLNRNYPFGWGSNVDANFITRGEGPGSEPEDQNVMEITLSHQVTVLVTNHTSEHTVLYPPLDLAAGSTPDLSSYKALGDATAAQNGYRSLASAEDYETSGETIDWSYYATRGFAYTIEEEPTSGSCASHAPAYVPCVIPDYIGTTPYAGLPTRNAFYLGLVYASLAGAHSVIGGNAPPGTTLKVTKDFDLYTAPVAPAGSPEAIPTHLESSMVVPASGSFSFHVNPSVRPNPPFRSDGEHTGPNGFLQESWTLTCTTEDSATTETRQVMLDKGSQVNLGLCGSPTAVTLRSFSAVRLGSRTVSLRWWTASEAGLLGFNVYRVGPGGLVRLNRDLISGAFGASPAGQAYSWLDRGAIRASGVLRYRLQAVRLDGTRVWLGSATSRR